LAILEPPEKSPLAAASSQKPARGELHRPTVVPEPDELKVLGRQFRPEGVVLFADRASQVPDDGPSLEKLLDQRQAFLLMLEAGNLMVAGKRPFVAMPVLEEEIAIEIALAEHDARPRDSWRHGEVLSRAVPRQAEGVFITVKELIDEI
jgi:hypothetical protein